MNVPVDAVRVGLAAFLLATALLKLLVRTDLVAAAARLGVPRTWLLGRRGQLVRPGLIAIELLLAAGLGVNSNFLAFAGAAAVAAVLLGAIGIKIKSKTPIAVGASNV